MHVLGLHGMPRRVYTYQAALGWGPLNLLASAGAVLMFFAVSLFLINVVTSLLHGATASDNPWNAGTLEWATSSPPPFENFPLQPTAGGRDPLWDNAPDQPVVTGFREGVHEVLVTHVLDAEPDHRLEMPTPSIWPLLTAMATTLMFIWSIFTPWGVVYGSVPMFVAMTGWFWPKSASEGGTQPWPIACRTLP
jgi:cytochrome c oxidase subunit 1